MTVELSDEDARLVHEILAQEYLSLKEEINKTEDTDFKRMLKGREARIQALLARLKTVVSS